MADDYFARWLRRRFFFPAAYVYSARCFSARQRHSCSSCLVLRRAAYDAVLQRALIVVTSKDARLAPALYTRER